MPSGREIVGKCTDAYGRDVDGLTYEGELNKVGTSMLVWFVGARRMWTKQCAHHDVGIVLHRSDVTHFPVLVQRIYTRFCSRYEDSAAF